jgi:capsular exopolysaccharide synthesis family protein
MHDTFDFDDDQNKNENILLGLQKYIKHWRWFVLSLILSLLAVILSLRYSTPIYTAGAKILVRDDKKGDLSSGAGAFADMALFGGGKKNVDNEIEILNSKTLIAKVIERLNLNIVYVKLGNFRDVELYTETCPFELVIQNASPVFKKNSQSFMVKFISADRFRLNDDVGKEIGIFHADSTINLVEASLVVRKTPYHKGIANSENVYQVLFNPVVDVAKQYLGNLTVESHSETSSVVNLKLTHAVPAKAEDFLNTLIEIYNQEAINDKNIVSENTLNFIQDRLSIVNAELGDIENETENFKKTNNVTDIATDAKLVLEMHSDFELSLIETETQLRIVAIMTDFLKNKSKTELIPIDIIPKVTGTGQVNPSIVEYNNLVLKRNRLINDGSTINYVITNIDQQLEELNQTIKMSLAQFKSSLILKRDDLAKQEEAYSLKLNNVPAQEKSFRIIDRQQKIKEGIYLYLIQKREETAIALTIAENNAKVIDAGSTNYGDVTPKKKNYYLAGILIGFALPFAVIYLIFLLDNKIRFESDVVQYGERNSMLGAIPKNLDAEENRGLKKEAFRSLLQNANFILPQNEKGKVILVASSLKGEGKSFVTYNLGVAYAESSKKVLIIGSDLRNPQLHHLFNLPKNRHGLSNYLYSNEVNWRDLVVTQKTDPQNLDVILSGEIPPNPQLLLSSNRFKQLLIELRDCYDVILIDSAPILLVSDTLNYANLVDATLYLFRAGLSPKNLVTQVIKLDQDGKLNNVGFVLNGLDLSSQFGYSYGYSYSYGYGYGYGKDVIPLTLKVRIQRRLKGLFYIKA